MNKIVTRATAVLLSACLANPAYANPVGGSVVGGSANATISGQGTPVTTIHQNANRVIINWQDFSIGAGEVTRFIQPSAHAAALNRVVSGNPSTIYGSLQANGRVFVINPNGILVGAGGQIDTKAFVASTLNILDSSFMKGGDLKFSGDSSASIRNDGVIQALGGDVFLIAQKVENSGTINAPGGTVGLAAGSEVRLVQSGNERLSVIAGNSSASGSVGVNNSGTIETTSAELKAAGGNIYALAINNGGVVRATGIERRNGRVYLTTGGGNIENSGTLSARNADGSGGKIVVDGGHNATAPATVINSGTIDARGDAAGASGGTVHVLGDHVGLFGNSLVDVSGDAGGGTALIGGDYRGGNSSIQNAQRTFVGSDAEVRADALGDGDGGKVIFWADESTRFYGSVSARGGAAGGDGGFVEISGGTSLIALGHKDLSAPLGAFGTLLYDPLNILIQGGTGDGTDQGNAANNNLQNNPGSDTAGTIAFTDEGAANEDPFIIRESEIEGTDANIILEARNGITVSGTFGGDDVTLQNGRSLTMRTRNDAGDGIAGIDLTAGGTLNNLEFVTSGGGSITLQTGTGGSEAGAAPITVGILTADGDVGTTGVGGNITVQAEGTLTVNGAVTTGAIAPASGTSVTTGSIQLGSQTANVVVNAPVSTGNATVDDDNGTQTGTSGSISITAGTSVTIGGGGSLTTGNVTWDNSGQNGGSDSATSGSISILAGASGAVAVGGNLTTGSATLSDDDGTSNDDVATSGGISISSGTSITGGGALTTGAATLSGNDDPGADTATSGSIALTAGAGAVSGGIGLSAANALTVGTAQGGGSGAADTATAGNIVLNSIGEINNGTGSTPLNLRIGDAAGATENQGSLTASTTAANGNIFITSALNLLLNAITTGGGVQNVAINTSGGANLTVLDSAESVSGDNVTLNSGTGTLTVNDALFNVGAGTLTLTGDEINLAGGPNSIQGSGNVTLQTSTAANNIRLSGAEQATTLDLTATDLAALQDGFNSITIGRSTDGSGSLTVVGSTIFNDNVTLVNGSLALDNVINAGANNVTLIARTAGITRSGPQNIIANALSVTSAGNVGSGANRIATDTADLTTDTTANNSSQFFTEANNLTALNMRAGNGAVSLTVNGTLTDTDAATDIAAQSAAVTATSVGSAANRIQTDVDDLSVDTAAANGAQFLHEVTSLTALNLAAGAATIDLTAAGSIADADGSTDIAATSLAIQAATGINGVQTAVQNLEAQTDSGGIAINNSGALNIGGVSAALNGVRVITSGGIQLVNDASVSVTASGENVVAPGNVSIQANGAASDIVTGGSDGFPNAAVRSTAGDVNLEAGRDILLGNLLTGWGNVQAGVNLVLDAGRDVIASQDSWIDSHGAGTVSIVANNNVSFLDTSRVGSEGGTISITTGAGGTLTFAAASSGIIRVPTFTPIDGDVILTSDNMDLGAVINAGSGRVSLQTVTAGRQIDLGTETAGRLSLTDAELDRITASTLQVGDANAGAITVSAAISPLNAATLALVNNATVNGAAAPITVGNLRVSSAGPVTLTAANDVNNLAIASSGNGNGVTFFDADNVTIGSVDTVNGVSANNGAISITTGNGALVVNNTAAANDVNAGNSTVTLTAASLGNDNPISLAAGATVNGSGGVTLLADNMTFGAGAAIDAGAGTATLRQFENGTAINLGGTDGAGVLGLSGSELGGINAGLLRIGNANSGNIAVSAAIAPAGATTVSLQSGGSISQGAGATITANNLALTAGSGIALGEVNQVATLAANANGSITYQDASALTIGSVDGVNGVAANNNAVSISTVNGALTVNDTAAAIDVDAGTSTLALTAGSSGNDNDLTLSAGAAVRGTSGVNLQADNMTFDSATINGGIATVTLRPFENGTAINLGGADAGNTLGLTAAELDAITATILRIGNAGAGNVNVSAAIAPAVATVLSIQTGGSISQGGAGTITENSLALNAGSTITLNNANQVNTLAANANGAVQYRDADSFTVGTVDGISGVDAGNGAVTLTAASAGNDNALTLAAGSTVSGNGGVTLVADNMIFDATSAVDGGPGMVTLRPFENGTSVDLGGADGVGTLGISDMELDRVSGNIIQIGDDNAGSILITALITPANLTTPFGGASPAGSILSLHSGGSITEIGAGAIRVANICLHTDAGPGVIVELLGNNDFDNVAAEGQLIRVFDVTDFSTANAIAECDESPSIDRGQPSFVPEGSELIRFAGTDKTVASAAALAGLSSVSIPTPKLDTSTFSSSSVSADQANQILPAGSIGTLWLQLPFPPSSTRRYKAEDMSKWTSGRIAAVGTTAGPQTPK